MDRILLLHVIVIFCLLGVCAPNAAADQEGVAVRVTGELEQWHTVTLTMDGPYASETATDPNPFTDYSFQVRFTHASGESSYIVPGYFAADGNAAQTSANAGNQWRAHFTPDRSGTWRCELLMIGGKDIALVPARDLFDAEMLAELDEAQDITIVRSPTVVIDIAESGAEGRDFRAHGRLEYVRGHYLRFAGSGEYFLKAGADSPETLLAYADFDDTVAPRNNAPLKTYEAHLDDWNEGDPQWGDGRGRGLIGAINYLSSTGCNAFSFLPYNAGGDGDNVWPFADRDDPLHYDCSKLDQWGIVFEHAMTRGMFLHFKLQETEIDDTRTGRNNNASVPTALDDGDLGPERKLYLRELVARYGHLLALNWNLGEENTQSTEQQRAMAEYLRAVDPYDHHIVIHTYPNRQEQVYGPLLGDGSPLTGASLQSSNVRDCHWQTLRWVQRSAQADRPWVVAFDEPGDATFGSPPDPEYPGMDRIDNVPLTIHDVRKYALWGTLMAGGCGVELYFGYRLPQNDLNCEDWRSRAQTWGYCDIALTFFREHDIPFWEMRCMDALINTEPRRNTGYCFAKPGEVYLVYLPEPREIDIDLAAGAYSVSWFNPRQGGDLIPAGRIEGGEDVAIPGMPQSQPGDDWLAVIRAVEPQ